MLNSDSELLVSAPFWKTRLEALCHPVAIRMAEDLDISGPLGIGDSKDPFWKGFKHSQGKKDSNIDFLLEIKRQHPEKIIIIQVGEFYETWGLDAIFLVEHCGLNRMGKKGPRAGTPLPNIQIVLDGLTAAGFSAVVCEQTDGLTKSGRKNRFISEVITPSSPIYTHGMAMDKKRWEVLFPDTIPEFGLISTAKGLTLVEVNPDLKTLHLRENMTPEATQARIGSFAGRLSRIFCHENVAPPTIERCQIQNTHLIKVSDYSVKDFPRRMIELIQIDLQLDAQTSFTEVSSSSCHEILPRPLYLSTAQQLGLMDERGIPPLLRSLLPLGSPVTCQNIFKSLLLNPPPLSIARNLRQVLNDLHSETPLPQFSVCAPSRYLKTLQKKEANPEILKDLQEVVKNFLTCDESLPAKTLTAALSIVSHLTGLKADQRLMRQSSAVIAGILDPILPQKEDPSFQPQSEHISPYLFESLEEEFRGRIARASNLKVLEAYKHVEMAAENYQKVLEKDFISLRETQRVNLSFDLYNRTIWLRGKIKKSECKSLYHPRDRYGKEVKDRWTTKRVEKALQKYKDSITQAREEVSQVLQKVSIELSSHHRTVIHLATFSNLLRTLTLHLRECQPKGWSLKVQDNLPNADFTIRGFTPYWMGRDEAVRNDLHLSGVSLLTGHNMAGKSTTLRASAVVSLLAACGLFFPAESVTIPQPIESWFVRTGNHDDPASGLSAFAVEMSEMQVALRDLSPQSLIFVDELGKGTESQSGHAIAASLLEHLKERKAKGLFATHWHEFFSNAEIDLSGISKVQMQTINGKPTYQIQPGFDLTSSAFQTAADFGIAPEIIHRAQQIAQGRETQSPPLSQAANTQKRYEASPFKKINSLIRKHLPDQYSEMRLLSPDQSPPLDTINSHIVYILKTSQGFYYVGETDDFSSRLETHRKIVSKRDAEVLYLFSPHGKSQGRRLETQIIKLLISHHFPMLSAEDAKHHHFAF